MAKVKQPVLTEEQKREMRLKEIIVETFQQEAVNFPQPQDGHWYKQRCIEYANQAVDRFNAEMAAKENGQEAADNAGAGA